MLNFFDSETLTKDSILEKLKSDLNERERQFFLEKCLDSPELSDAISSWSTEFLRLELSKTQKKLEINLVITKAEREKVAELKYREIEFDAFKINNDIPEQVKAQLTESALKDQFYFNLLISIRDKFVNLTKAHSQSPEYETLKKDIISIWGEEKINAFLRVFSEYTALEKNHDDQSQKVDITSEILQKLNYMSHHSQP